MDPLLEQDLGTGVRGWHAPVSRDDDPMLHKFLHDLAVAAPAPNFAPDDGEEDSGSPAYVSFSGLWSGGASTHPEAHQPEANCGGGQEEITLETGVQLAPHPCYAHGQQEHAEALAAMADEFDATQMDVQ